VNAKESRGLSRVPAPHLLLRGWDSQHAQPVSKPGSPTQKGSSMAKYGSTAQKEVKKSMHEFKKGKLKSGKSNKKVKNRKQAIAIGLSKARKKGGKVPSKKK
jgi:hypothetical protein